MECAKRSYKIKNLDIDVDTQADKLKFNALKNLNSGGLKHLASELIKKINIVQDLVHNSMEDMTLIRDFEYVTSNKLNQESIASLSQDVNSRGEGLRRGEGVLSKENNKELLLNRMLIKELNLKLHQTEELLKEYKEK